jgi:hypothetical protein
VEKLEHVFAPPRDEAILPLFWRVGECSAV